MILALLFVQDLQLGYKYEKGQTFETRSDATFTLSVDGTDTAMMYIMSSAEFLSFQKIHAVGAGKTTVRGVDEDGVAKFRSKPASARFDGLYDDAPFEHAFDYPSSAPEDPLAAALWAMGSEVANTTIDRRGAARNLKQEDATAEALFFIATLAPRLPSDGRVHAFFDGPDEDNAARHKFEITFTLKWTTEDR